MIVTVAPLYNFDASSVPVRLKPLFRRVSVSGSASNTQNADFTNNESQYVLIIQHAHLEVTPNAADVLNESTLRVRSPGVDATPVQYILRENPTATAAGVKHVLTAGDISGQLLLMPGWVLRGSVTKAASANQLSMLLDVVGMFVPLGNLSVVA